MNACYKKIIARVNNTEANKTTKITRLLQQASHRVAIENVRKAERARRRLERRAERRKRLNLELTFDLTER